MLFFFFPSKRTGLNPPTDWFWAAGRMLDTPCLKQRNVLLIIRSTFAGFFFLSAQRGKYFLYFWWQFFFFFSLSDFCSRGITGICCPRCTELCITVKTTLITRREKRGEERRGGGGGGESGLSVWFAGYPIQNSFPVGRRDCQLICPGNPSVPPADR